jgi:hypothetical protein
MNTYQIESSNYMKAKADHNSRSNSNQKMPVPQNFKVQQKNSASEQYLHSSEDTFKNAEGGDFILNASQ